MAPKTFPPIIYIIVKLKFFWWALKKTPKTSKAFGMARGGLLLYNSRRRGAMEGEKMIHSIRRFFDIIYMWEWNGSWFITYFALFSFCLNWDIHNIEKPINSLSLWAAKKVYYIYYRHCARRAVLSSCSLALEIISKENLYVMSRMFAIARAGQKKEFSVDAKK